MEDYKLRCTLTGHSSDVRAVSVCDSEICTGSRDQTAILWALSEQNSNIYEPKLQYSGHSDYVMCVCLIATCEKFPEKLTVTGSKDKSILVYPRYSTTPVHTLEGHENAVSSLSWKNGVLASGSWDHSAIIWENWKQKFILKGHTGPVWSVLILSTNNNSCQVITASADKTIILWSNNVQRTVFRGHTDCVRDLSVIDDSTFLSCSNDASVKMWKINGECLDTFYGHTNYIYSVDNLFSQCFVSGGEDRTFRVWNTRGQNVQTLFLPGQSVWAVSILPNGDILAGVSDYNLYVFSKAPERQADENTQKEFNEKLAKSSLTDLDLGGLSRTDLPDEKRLHSPGTKDGQTVMVRDQNKVFCYSWSASECKWNKVGEVVGGAGGSAGSSGKVLYQGKEYDYVFDVDTELGTLKLPYDLSDDPWLVAQKFIHTYNLPQDHLTQVAEFIIKNAHVTTYSTPTYSDPFTGGSRYIPGSTSSAAPQETSSPTKRYNHFPHRTPLSFQTMNKIGLLTKLKEMNDQVEEKISQSDLEQLVEDVCSDNPKVNKIKVLEKALQWPVDKIWPVLDILRLALRSASAQKLCLGNENGEKLLLLLRSLLKCDITTVRLLCLRAMANMACHPPGRQILVKNNLNVVGDVVDTRCDSANHEIALATVFLNQAVCLLDLGSFDNKMDTLGASMKSLISFQSGDALHRILVAMGTLAISHEEVLSYGRSLDLKKYVSDKINIQCFSNHTKLQESGKELLDLL